MILFLDVCECAVNLPLSVRLRDLQSSGVTFIPKIQFCIPYQTQHERAMIESIGWSNDRMKVVTKLETASCLGEHGARNSNGNCWHHLIWCVSLRLKNCSRFRWARNVTDILLLYGATAKLGSWPFQSSASRHIYLLQTFSSSSISASKSKFLSQSLRNSVIPIPRRW